MRAVESNGGDHRAPDRFGTSRRTVLVGGVAAAAVTTLPMASPPAQALSGAAYDPRQRFLSFVGIGNGQLLALQADGQLFWYRNSGWATAAAGWTSGGGQAIGDGWSGMTTVMGSNDGSVYALRADGALFRYHYTTWNPTTGAGTWDISEQIGNGWDIFTEVIGFDGDFYGRRADGSVLWYHYDTGSKQWTASGRQLAGFNFTNSRLHADAGGVLYGVTMFGATGKISWYRQINGVWQRGSGAAIGSGFGDFSINGMYFAGNGLLYVVRPDMPGTPTYANLVAYRLTNYLTAGASPSWANNARGNTVGHGWSVEPWAALQGYPTTPSVAAGDTAEIAVSTTFSNVTWSVLRLGGPQPTAVSPAQSGSLLGGVQLLPGDNYLATGCGWTPNISVNTGGFASGAYIVRLQAPSGLTRDIPFIVRPASGATKAPIAFLMPTLTHHAYNTWGGHSQYCQDLAGQQRFLNLARPSRQKPTGPTGVLEHTLYTDILLLQWLETQGFEVDVYDDVDLHNNPNLFAGYQVAVLGSHAEYWSLSMRQGLSSFLAAGGNLISAGGNGLYEAVDIDSSSGLVTYRVSASLAANLTATTGQRVTTGARRIMSLLGYPESLLLGVSYNDRAYFNFAPYQVTLPDGHPLLAGTGLTTGSTFGWSGYNGAASGWEHDAILPGYPGQATSEQVIAHGRNQVNGGAVMTYRPTGAGGYVFSASSISFVGALANDAAQSRLFKNVFTSMLGPAPSTTAAPMSPAPMHQVAPIVPESPHD